MSPPLRYPEKSKPFKKKDYEKESPKFKHFTEEFICSISYTIDETTKDIISIYVKEINRNLCDTKNSSNKLSLSSGTLGDVSGSEGSSVYSSIEKFTIPPKLSITSSSSLSSVSSTSSSLPSGANKLHHSSNKFLIPQALDLKKHLNNRCKGSVCQCFCSKFVNCLLKQPSSSRCLTPEMLNSSSENLKIDSQESIDRLHEKIKKEQPKHELVISEVSEETTLPGYSSRLSVYIPTGSNLPVFAKWPGNSWFYPGIVENTEEETWHTSSHLEVKFCDGTVRNTNTQSLFPAYLLPTKTELVYDKDGDIEINILKSVKKLPDNELLFVAESGEHMPFQKICFSATHYKELLKENSSVLTPRKTPKFSVNIANVQQGKRNRIVVKREDASTSSESKQKISLSTKKTPSFRKVKRGRSTTDGSSSEKSKTEKKKIRGSSQKKLPIETKKVKEISTPLLGDSFEKKEVARKLSLETPGCSYKHAIDSKTVDTSIDHSSSDAESSGNQQIVFDDIYSPYLDEELIPDISRNTLRTKSSLKKHVTYRQKNIPENVNKLGPLPVDPLFVNYNFVLTHSKKKVVKPPLKQPDEQSYSEEGTDFEDYYETTIPFEHLWIREQIISGGGKVYRSLLDVPQNEHKNTIVITDNIFETPNYLLAVSLGIPIYRHDLIIDCCTQKKVLSLMINTAMKMPNGRSLETCQWVETAGRQPLKNFCCLLCIDANTSTLQFFKKLILNAGGTVVTGGVSKIISGQGSQISFIIGDLTLSEEIENLANCYKIPIVSTVWLIQTIIHGKPKNYNSHREYDVHFITSQEEHD